MKGVIICKLAWLQIGPPAKTVTDRLVVRHTVCLSKAFGRSEGSCGVECPPVWSLSYGLIEVCLKTS